MRQTFSVYAEEAKRNYGTTIPSARADQRFITLQAPVGVVAAVSAVLGVEGDVTALAAQQLTDPLHAQRT